MPLPSLARHTVDGIPVYTADIRTSFTGTLVFGVGIRDEPLRTAGTAHLLEHLVMQRLGKVAISHNASTSDEAISFYAQGAPHLVADFLSRVAAAVSSIGEITEEEVARQRRVIHAELGDTSEYHGRGVLLDRFGARSIGLIDVGSPAHLTLTRDDAVSFAETWLHAGNAAVAFTGDIPDGFSLALPVARPLPNRPNPEVIRSGSWVSNGSIPVVISLVLDTDAESYPTERVAAASWLIADVLQDSLRTELQLVYSVQPFVAVLTPNRRFVSYSLDARPGDAVAAAAAALARIRELAASAPSTELMQVYREQWTHAEDDPMAQADYLENHVVSVLRGRTDPYDLRNPELARVTNDDIKTVIEAALPSLFVTFGDDILEQDDEEVSAALALPGVASGTARLAALTKMQLARHLMADGVESFSPRMLRGMRGAEIILDHEGITFVHSDGLADISYSSIAMASYSERDSLWLLLEQGGDFFVIDLDDWRRRELLDRLLRERIPAQVQFAIHTASPQAGS